MSSPYPNQSQADQRIYDAPASQEQNQTTNAPKQMTEQEQSLSLIEQVNEQVNAQILCDKGLRVYLDKGLQDLKDLPASRERALSITKLQECIMWLGMDMKRLGALVGTEPINVEARGKRAYHRYGDAVKWTNFRGDPMPQWDDLPESIRGGWMAAAIPDGPYPSSYGPSSTKVEPVADGLKM